jgi:predicted secreted acid phosphatase
MIRRLALVLMVGFLPAFGQQSSTVVAGEPVNLQAVKDGLTNYESCQLSNCYLPQIEHQIDVAMGLLKESVAEAKPGEKLALVLDIDETSLSNWSVETKDDFGYIPQDSNNCIKQRCGTAIAGTLKLFKEAEADHVAVFFITGRPEPQREDTAANLKAVGYDHWEHLSLRPVDHAKDQTVTDYKSGERAKILKQGYRIVLNVGDQLSDLNGPAQAEHSVKLPNPFYFIQ